MSSQASTRRVHLVRHAKSSWDDPTLVDHERPLNRRGLKAAAKMARWIEANDVHPELVLCSSAVRARETLAQLEHVLGSPRIVIADSLYGASAEQLADRLGRVPHGTREVMIVGHNPGLADLCLLLARGSRARQQVAVKFPTGALATLETPTSWADIAPESAKIVHLVVPSELD